MGLGLLGRGVGDITFLAEQGAEIIVTDLKSEDELSDSVRQLKKYPNVSFVLGEHRLADFRNRDYILKAASVPLDSPYIAEAEKEGTPIKMSASWFAKLSDIPLIGVTGTRGKSTVTHMLHEILWAADTRVLLGGNVRSISNLALLEEVTPESIALFELDSWQLQGFGDAEMSPHIAIFTTFMEDHMNYYRSSPSTLLRTGMDRYLEDKAHIFKHQTEGDTLILGSQCAELVQEKYPHIKSNIVVADTSDISYDLAVPGEHNRYNAACAAAAARAFGIDERAIEQTLKSFLGVPGRLEFVRAVNGVSFYNDTTSTMPHATLAALKALKERGDIILIMGGADKKLDMTELMEAIPEYTKATVLLAGTGTDKLLESHYELDEGQEPYTDLKRAVEGARDVAKKGDIVLFSPAFASFGMFKNEFDRGEQFVDIVNNLS